MKNIKIPDDISHLPDDMKRVYVTALQCVYQLMKYGSSPVEAELIVYTTLKEMDSMLLNNEYDQVIIRLHYIFLDAPIESLMKVILKYK